MEGFVGMGWMGLVRNHVRRGWIMDGWMEGLASLKAGPLARKVVSGRQYGTFVDFCYHLGHCLPRNIVNPAL